MRCIYSDVLGSGWQVEPKTYKRIGVQSTNYHRTARMKQHWKSRAQCKT